MYFVEKKRYKEVRKRQKQEQAASACRQEWNRGMRNFLFVLGKGLLPCGLGIIGVPGPGGPVEPGGACKK